MVPCARLRNRSSSSRKVEQASAIVTGLLSSFRPGSRPSRQRPCFPRNGWGAAAGTRTPLSASPQEPAQSLAVEPARALGRHSADSPHRRGGAAAASRLDRGRCAPARRNRDREEPQPCRTDRVASGTTSAAFSPQVCPSGRFRGDSPDPAPRPARPVRAGMPSADHAALLGVRASARLAPVQRACPCGLGRLLRRPRSITLLYKYFT